MMVYTEQNSQNFSGLFLSSRIPKTRRFGNWICFRNVFFFFGIPDDAKVQKYSVNSVQT
jgi:hypothetical protein